MKKQLVVVILVFTMVWLSALNVWAEDETELITETVVQTDVQESAEDSTQISAEVYINPLYEGDVIEAELLEAIEEVQGVGLFARESYLTSESDVASVIREGMEARQETICVYYAASSLLEEGWLARWMDLAVEETDSPRQGDYLRYNYGGASGNGSVRQSEGIYYHTVNITVRYYSTAEQEAVVTEHVNNLISEFNFKSDTTDYMKIKTIYDWVCANVTYDYQNLDDDSYKLKYTAYAALVNKTAVCQGYASLMYRLFREVGVNTRVISGNGNGGPHAWNIVKLGGVYYNVDATWDAGQLRYQYFLINDENFTNHIRDGKFTTSEFYAMYPMATENYSTPSAAVWKLIYDANGGKSAPLPQEKVEGTDLQLTLDKPTKNYILTYDGNGASVDVEMKTVDCVFKNWNTRPDGKGVSYDPGDLYTADETVTLYAQWANPKAGTLLAPTRSGYTFDGWYTAANGGSKMTSDTVITKSMTIYAHWKSNEPVYTDNVEAFVAQLYKVCLNRTPDTDGLAAWTRQLKNKEKTGIEVAYGFIFSAEFKEKNLCNDDYVEQLYKAFLGRDSDPSGKEGWVQVLREGATREEIFNGFALSQEFKGLCDKYGILQGEAVNIPLYGTIPTDSCSVCGKEDGVTGFVKRLYRVCLEREADGGGLNAWRSALRDHTETGRGVAYGFIFSNEFIEKNYSDSDYVEHLYEAFMGRSSDPSGKENWVKVLAKGQSRKDVFDGFVGSDEFTKICNSYGIVRD